MTGAIKNLLPALLDLVLTKLTSDDIGEEIANYHLISDQESAEEAWSHFTDRYELGNWLYEAVILEDIDLPAILDSIRTSRLEQEKLAAENHVDTEHDLREMTGGVVMT